jgi:hypothetical protein
MKILSALFQPSQTMARGGILVLLAGVLLLTACSRLTEANLQKIHNNMSPDEVKAILGDPTSVQSSGVLGITGTTFIYHSGSSDVKITFLNDKVLATEGEFK